MRLKDGFLAAIRARLKRRLRYTKELLKHFSGGLYNRLGRHHVFLLAGGLSFSIIICIIPFTLIVFSVTGIILEQPSITDDINHFIDRAIPYEKYASKIKDIVFSRIEEFRIYKSFAGIVGSFGLLFAASGLFSSMRTILDIVYLQKSGPSAIVAKLRDMGMVVLVLIYFLLSTTILPGIDIVLDLARKLDIFHIFDINYVQDLALSVISFLIIFATFYGIYFLVPYKRLSNKAIIISAFFTALLWELAKEVFGFYIANLANMKRIYGAYTLLIVAVFWIFYTSIVFIIGAEIGQLYTEWQRKKVRFLNA